MGRGKLSMQLIEKEESRMTAYEKRKEGLKKKAIEFSTLCGVPTCMIIYGPRLSKSNHRPADVQVWPEDPNDFMHVIHLYKDKKPFSSVRGLKSHSLVDHFADRKRKLDDQIAKTRKANFQLMFLSDSDDQMINRFSIHQLKETLLAVDERIDVATKKLNTMRAQHHHQPLQMIPAYYDMMNNPVLANPMIINGGDQMAGTFIYNPKLQQERYFDPSMGAMIDNRPTTTTTTMMMIINNQRATFNSFASTILQPLQHCDYDYEQQLPSISSHTRGSQSQFNELYGDVNEFHYKSHIGNP